MRMILQDTTLPLDETQRCLVGLIARYHRKALPKSDHPYFRDLTQKDRHRVEWMAGILRIADGLDRTHMNIIKQVDVQRTDQKLILRCHTKGPALPEVMEARKKASLLQRAAGKEIVILSG